MDNGLSLENEYSSLTLAYLGDGVYELFIREKLMEEKGLTVQHLHRKATGFVSAISQSLAMAFLYPLLTEDELQIYKRGRNQKSHSAAKNANILDYRRATGFEALIGYLHLSKKTERLEFILNEVYNYLNNQGTGNK